MALQQLVCPNCGAQMSLIQGSSKAYCESCDTVVLIDKQNGSDLENTKYIGTMEVKLSDADIHRYLVARFIDEPYTPLDLFTSVTLISVEKYSVSAFQFECDYFVSYNAQLENGTNLSNGNFTGGEYYYASGVEEYEEEINKIWWDGNMRNLATLENREIEDNKNSVCTYLPYTLSSSSVFERHIKPLVEEDAVKKVHAQFAEMAVRKLNIAEPIIKNTVSRVLLSVVKVNYFYNGQEYQLYLPGDGHCSYTKSQPIDDEARVKREKLEKIAGREKTDSKLVIAGLLIVLLGVAMMDTLTPYVLFALLALIVYFAYYTFKAMQIKKAENELRQLDKARVEAINRYLNDTKALQGCLQEAALASPVEANPRLVSGDS